MLVRSKIGIPEKDTHKHTHKNIMGSNKIGISGKETHKDTHTTFQYGTNVVSQRKTHINTHTKT